MSAQPENQNAFIPPTIDPDPQNRNPDIRQVKDMHQVMLGLRNGTDWNDPNNHVFACCSTGQRKPKPGEVNSDQEEETKDGTGKVGQRSSAKTIPMIRYAKSALLRLHDNTQLYEPETRMVAYHPFFSGIPWGLTTKISKLPQILLGVKAYLEDHGVNVVEEKLENNRLDVQYYKSGIVKNTKRKLDRAHIDATTNVKAMAEKPKKKRKSDKLNDEKKPDEERKKPHVGTATPEPTTPASEEKKPAIEAQTNAGPIPKHRCRLDTSFTGYDFCAVEPSWSGSDVVKEVDSMLWEPDGDDNPVAAMKVCYHKLRKVFGQKAPHHTLLVRCKVQCVLDNQIRVKARSIAETGFWTDYAGSVGGLPLETRSAQSWGFASLLETIGSTVDNLLRVQMSDDYRRRRSQFLNSDI